MSSDDDDETYVPSEEENEEETSYYEEERDEEFNPEDDFRDPLFNGYASAEENHVLYEDYNHLYVTELTFDTRDEGVSWIQQVGLANNMYFAIGSKKPLRTYIKCHRGEKYRETPTRDGAKPRESSGTVRICCPFQLVVERNKCTSRWGIRTMPNHGRHNHALGVNKEGYRWPSAIKAHEYESIRQWTEAGAQPAKILNSLKLPPKENYSNLQHIYNAKQKMRREYMGEVAPLGYFFKLLVDNGWYHTSRPIHGTYQIGDIFFADRRCVKICEQFSQVLLIDATYKTNKWGLPLVEVVGFVPTGENYHVAFAFLHNEKESSYTWLMEQLEEMLMDYRKPRLFVTDRELASMNAIRTVFPDATNLLCRRHIGVDVFNKLKKLVKNNDMQETLSDCWEILVNAQTEEAYEMAVFDLFEKFVAYPKFVNYLNKTWLSKYRTKFVAAWVDKHLHYGAVTTNRVESAHAQLKNEMPNDRGGFDKVWEDINKVVGRQLDSIKGAFEQSRSKMLKCAKPDSVFCRLALNVSHYAIKLMWGEIKHEWQRNPTLCNCSLWTSHGLPCMCRILDSNKKKMPIDLKDVDPFWRSLYLDGSNVPPADDGQRATGEDLLDESVRLYKQRHKDDDLQMRRLAMRLRRETNPEFSNYEIPPEPPVKGRPKKATGSRFKSFRETRWKKTNNKKSTTGPDGEFSMPRAIFELMPIEIRNFLTRYVDVLGDGNCGYRVLASWLFDDVERWNDVRSLMTLELQRNAAFWWQYYGNEYEEILARVNHYESPCAMYYWMDAFYMLPLAATRFQKIICFYTREGSCTYLPLRCDYTGDDWEVAYVPPLPGIWHIGFMPGHFFFLDAPSDAPKPMAFQMWKRNCQNNIKPWSRMLNCSRGLWIPR